MNNHEGKVNSIFNVGKWIHGSNFRTFSASLCECHLAWSEAVQTEPYVNDRYAILVLSLVECCTE